MVILGHRTTLNHFYPIHKGKREARDGEGRMTMWSISRENLRDQWCHTPFPCILWSEFNHADLWATREARKGSVPGCPGEIEIKSLLSQVSPVVRKWAKRRRKTSLGQRGRVGQKWIAQWLHGSEEQLPCCLAIESQLSIWRFGQAAGAGQLVECLLTLCEALGLILTWLAWSRRGGTCLRCQKLVDRNRKVRSARLFLAIPKM